MWFDLLASASLNMAQYTLCIGVLTILSYESFSPSIDGLLLFAFLFFSPVCCTRSTHARFFKRNNNASRLATDQLDRDGWQQTRQSDHH